MKGRAEDSILLDQSRQRRANLLFIQARYTALVEDHAQKGKRDAQANGIDGVAANSCGNAVTLF